MGLEQLPEFYRPLYISDAGAKLLEYILQGRLQKVVGTEGLADNQFCFRNCRSTVQAMHEAMREADTAVRKRKDCPFLTFDVRNAFNLLLWSDILDELKR